MQNSNPPTTVTLTLPSVFIELCHGHQVQPGTVLQGNLRIAGAKRVSTRYAMVLWACVLVAAFCGVVKPIG